MTTVTLDTPKTTPALAKLTKIDRQLAHTDAQLVATKADADAAYQARDAALVAKLFTRTQALERQRQDFDGDRTVALAEVRAAFQPQLDAVLAEARQTVDGWGAATDEAIAGARDAARRLLAGIEALRHVADERTRYRARTELGKRLQAIAAEAGGALDLPALPEAPAIPFAQVEQVFRLVSRALERHAGLDARLRGRLEPPTPYHAARYAPAPEDAALAG